MKIIFFILGLLFLFFSNFSTAQEEDLTSYYCVTNDTNVNYVFCFCENDSGSVSNVNGLGGRINTGKIKENYCKNSKEITYGRYLSLNGYLPNGKYKPFGERQYFETASKNQDSDLFKYLSLKCNTKGENNEYVEYKGEYQCVSKNRNNEKETSYDEFAISLGCAIDRADLDDCVRRWLPSVIGTGLMTLEQIEEIKDDKELMGEIVLAIQEMQTQGGVREPTEEEKQQALAQQNATGHATWKYTSTGIGYFDFGNGFGWAPPNPKRDKIISGLLVSQQTKNKLMIGSRGRTIFIPG